jgi:hypothetical protein
MIKFATFKLNNSSSTESLENNLKISKPSEKVLEKERRNKRKSKIFERVDDADSEVDSKNFSNSSNENANENINNINNINSNKNENLISTVKEINPSSRSSNLFDFYDKEYDSVKNHNYNYTLELFQNLSVEDKDNASTTDSDKENLNRNLKQIMKELSATSETENMPSITSKKTNFSQKFKDSANSNSSYRDLMPTKRFKI